MSPLAHATRELTALTPGEIGELLGSNARVSSETLRAWGARPTLVRVLANLESMWSRIGDPRKAAAAQERLELLQR